MSTPAPAVREALLRAVEHAGSFRKLADAIQTRGGKAITGQGIRSWLLHGIPADRPVEVERAVGGAVKRFELRPDLYS